MVDEESERPAFTNLTEMARMDVPVFTQYLALQLVVLTGNPDRATHLVVDTGVGSVTSGALVTLSKSLVHAELS